MPAMYSTGYATMCASEYGVTSSAIGSLCVQPRCDHLRCGRARAGGAANRRRGRIRNIANRKHHPRARLVLAVDRNEAFLVQLQLLADQLCIGFDADAN